VKGPNPLHHHTHQAEVHMQMYIEGMCAHEVDEWILISNHASYRSTVPGGAFDSPSGCP
jgi:hypothetical protein